MNKQQQKHWHQVLMINREVDKMFAVSEPDWSILNQLINERTTLLKSVFDGNDFDASNLVSELHKINAQNEQLTKLANEQKQSIQGHLLGRNKVKQYIDNSR